MSSIQTQGMQPQGRQTVTAFFDSRADADRAAERIRSEGLTSSDIRVVEGNSDVAGSTEPRREHKGFWQALSDFFLPNEDRYAYAEGLSRGGFLVSVATTEANRARVVDILDDEGTVDFDAREASWRSEGWQGYRADDESLGSHSFDPSVADDRRRADTVADVGFGTGSAAAASGMASRTEAGTLSGTTPYEVTEDERFNRRDTSLNRSRVRAYHSDDLGGNVTGGERLSGLSEQVDRTDVEMEDQRNEELLDRDELARRNTSGSRSF